MNSIEFIRQSLNSSKEWAMGLIGDMQDAPLTQPTSNGGNHPLWVLGHVARAESDLLDVFILGKPNRFPEWDGLFEMGTTPSTDGSQYPSMDELHTKFETMRSATLSHLDTLSEGDLGQRSHAPEEFGAHFGTVGACFSAMIVHLSFHAGQVADARRAAGRDPRMS